ncbi:MAG: hypothetical protein EU531_10780 [Promethearchaeota archaeon]|nr:MAG: hypothetical protein EU531_10780 [Candidatus Lokiarchaeota archaeon]
MSTNLFPFIFKNERWYNAEGVNDSDIGVIVDTDRAVIWFFEGPKSSARNRSSAKELLADLRQKYELYAFKRISNDTPKDILEYLEELKKHDYITRIRYFQYDLEKISKYYFYLNNIGCLLLITAFTFLIGFLFLSDTINIDQFDYFSINFNRFLFTVNLISILFISSFIIFILTSFFGVILNKRALFIYNLTTSIVVFIAFFMLRIWDIILYYEIIGSIINIRMDAIFLFVFNLDIFLLLGLIFGYVSVFTSFFESKKIRKIELKNK